MVEFDNVVNSSTSALTPGKIILFGEHFVVYGYPSIIASIERFFSVDVSYYPEGPGEIIIVSSLGFTARKKGNEISFDNNLKYGDATLVESLYKIIEYINGVERIQKDPMRGCLKVRLKSELPLGGGLGSSSAFCVSLAAAFYYYAHKKVDKSIICSNSINAEKIININTSGADCTVSTFGGLGCYDKVKGFSKIDSFDCNIKFLVIDTGIAHDTYSMIQRVSKIKETKPELFSDICTSYLEIYQEGLESIREANLDKLGRMLDENHKLLSKISVSNTLIEKIIKLCSSNKMLGTKITGAGGGGCIISLFDGKSDYGRLKNELKQLDLKYFITQLNTSGLRIVQNSYH